uniref:Lipase_3 domain-containing protein n=1 Tax=Bursaphelenchus xylophilus TaxID=6326 RepID=A0A1I7SG46_BURXY
IKLITFGEPRYGDLEYAEAFNKLVPYSYRVENKRDLVTQIPPYKFENYTHQKVEVWYPDAVKVGNRYKECPATEDPQCQLSVNPFLDAEDHFFYYYDIVAAAASGCKI